VFDLFLSHVSSHAEYAGQLKQALAEYAVEAFVAHADIEPTREWEAEIRTALNSCEAFAVLLSDDAHESNWLDQESGWAEARGLYIIPVEVGLNPYGFLARYQAIHATHRAPGELADTVFDLLSREPRTAGSMIESVVTAYEQTQSFDEARWNFNLLQRVPAFTPNQLGRIQAAYETNPQIRQAWYVQNRIDDFLADHWAHYDDDTGGG
jgi:TIR domain-containing protein